jgi:DNA repair exonuclease SbcCD ATPase subunit
MHARDGLLLWCQKKTKDYSNVNVQNFTTSWRNGLAFCALIHKHRPDLIDYDKLDGKDMVGNLQLAFDVAEKELDIPQLLDAKDVADSERPDEKSIMAYVAYYWKKFASENKQQKSINMISRLGQKIAENQKVIHDYEERTKNLQAWTGEKTEKYSDCSDLGNTLEAVLQLYSKFKDYKNDEKPPKLSEKSDLEIMLKSLRTKQKNDGLEVYNPPEELSTSKTNEVWEKLGVTQDEYEKALKARIILMKNLEQLLDRFNARSKRLEEWEKSKKDGELAEDIEKLQTIPAIQSKIKTMDTFENQVETQKKNFVETKQMGEKIVDGGHAEAQKVSDKSKSCEDGLDEIEKLTKEFKDKLAALLEKKQLIEKKSIEFGNAVQQLNLVTDDATNSLFDSVASTTVEEVEKKIERNASCVQGLENISSILGQLETLDKEITELGADPAAFSSLNLEQAKAKHSTTSTKIGERKDELQKEKERQLEILKALDKWNTMAGAYLKYCDDQTKDLGQTESGSPKVQFESFNARATKVAPESADKFKECDEYYNSLDNDIKSKVKVSLESVSVSKDGIETLINRKSSELEKKIKFLEKTLNDFKAKTSKVDAFQTSKKEYFGTVESKATAINSIQAELRTIDTFTPELKGVKSSLEEAKKFGKILVDNLDESSEEVQSTLQKLESGNEEVENLIKDNKTKLQELLRVKQLVEEKSNQFANEVAALNLVVEDAKSFLEEPVESSTVEEAQQKIELNAGHVSTLSENKSVMETITKLHAEISELGGNSSVYSSISADEITKKYETISSEISERTSSLEKEKERQEEVLKLVTNWDEKSQKFVDDCTSKKAELEKPDEGSPKAQLAAFQARSAAPVEESKTQLQELETLHKELQEKDCVSRATVALRNVTVAQNGLESYAKRKVLDLDQKRKELERSLIKLKIRFDKIKNYSEEKNTSLDAFAAKTDTIGAIQANLQNLSGFENEFKGVQSAFATTEGMGQEFIASKHDSADSVQQMIDLAKDTLSKLEARVKEVDEQLKQKLADKQATEELCINFSKAAQTLDVYLEDLETKLSEKIKVSSVEEVVAIASATEENEKEYVEKEASVTEMSNIHKQISDKGENPQTYTTLTLDGLSSKYDALKNEFATKKEAIATEKQKQEENVKLISEFTTEFGAYQDFVTKTSDEVENISSGSLEEQLKSVKDLAEKAKPQSQQSVDKLCSSFEKVEAADIAEQAPATVQEINGLNERLQKVFNKRMETLESGILSQKQSNISEEQLKDFRDTFKFFDKENTGSLTKFPFKAACAAAGEDIPDEHLEKVFKEFDADGDGKISFDEFISFISSVAKEGAGKGDLMTAFQEIAGGNKFLTEQQIVSNFAKEQAQHFLTEMKKTDEGYDYESYLNASFSS